MRCTRNARAWRSWKCNQVVIFWQAILTVVDVNAVANLHRRKFYRRNRRQRRYPSYACPACFASVFLPEMVFGLYPCIFCAPVIDLSWDMACDPRRDMSRHAFEFCENVSPIHFGFLSGTYSGILCRACFRVPLLHSAWHII